MIVNSLKRDDTSFPEQLLHIDPIPETLFWRGSEPHEWIDRPKVAVVGSRKATVYGLHTCTKMVRELASAGVVIISGLAFGIDATAHRAALEAGGMTVAILPSDTKSIYPATNRVLADHILKSRGTLLSEYESNPTPKRYDFIARNRIISGLADVILIPEATIKSGSLHTARFALSQGRTVLAVPGDINRATSEGCNHLIKSGALLASSSDDILLALGYNPAPSKKLPSTLHPDLVVIINLLQAGPRDTATLQAESSLSPNQFFGILTELELKALIRPLSNGQWALA